MIDFAALAPLVWGAAYLVVVMVLTRAPRPRPEAPAADTVVTDARFPDAA